MEECCYVTWEIWFSKDKLLSNMTVEEVTVHVVLASDVTPMDRWLNVWCIWYTYLETLQECQSRRRIGWIIGWSIQCDLLCPSNTVSARAFSERLLHREVNYSIPEFPHLPSYLFMRPGMVSRKIKKLLWAALDHLDKELLMLQRCGEEDWHWFWFPLSLPSTLSL